MKRLRVRFGFNSWCKRYAGEMEQAGPYSRSGATLAVPSGVKSEAGAETYTQVAALQALLTLDQFAFSM